MFTSPEEFLTLLNALPPLSRLTINDSLDVYTSPITSHYSRQKNALTFETKLNLSLLQELIITRGSGHERQPLRALVNAFAAQACSVKILDILGYWSALGPYDAGREDFSRYVAGLLGVASGSLTTLRLHFPAYDSNGITSFLRELLMFFQYLVCNLEDRLQWRPTSVRSLHPAERDRVSFDYVCGFAETHHIIPMGRHPHSFATQLSVQSQAHEDCLYSGLTEHGPVQVRRT